MEYSLNDLTKKITSNGQILNLTLQEFIDVLNLIGFEVDEINVNKSNILNSLETNLLIKLPPNREDLMIEKNFLKELSTLFLLKLNNNWQNIKFLYLPLLKTKYLQYYNYKEVEIPSNYPQILSYLIELKDLKFSNSPKWIQSKLKKAGKIVKNNLNDIIELTNSEWGQSFNSILVPDQSIDSKAKLSVELLKEVQTIDFSNSNIKQLNLQPGTIVLKLNDSIVSVLGLSTISITNDVNVLFENDLMVENFPNKIKSTYLQAFFYNIYNNELSLNFIKNKVSLKALRKETFENFRFSFQRLLTLLDLIYSPSINSIVYSTKENQLFIENQKIICLELRSLYSFLNEKKVDLKVFAKAGLKVVCKTSEMCYLSIPVNRRDLDREIDLIEEYTRFIGYKNFPEIAPVLEKSVAKKKTNNILFLKQFFSNNGFNEILSNSIDDLKKSKNYSISISNPLNNEFSVLRTDLISKLLNIFEQNTRTNLKSQRFFEIGRIFKILDNKILEIERLSGIFQLEKVKKNLDNNIEWFEAKGLIEHLLQNFGYMNLHFEKISENFTNYHPTRSVFIKSEDKILGMFGQTNPKFKALENLKYATYIFEFNLVYFGNERINNSTNKIYKENSKYPSIRKDLSFFVDIKKDFLFLKEKLMQSSQYLKNFEFFDVFFDSLLDEKVKVGIRLEFQSNSKTLTNEFIEKEISNIKMILINYFEVEFS
jgi:phenylalanyl-tRNA synthetase beta chain